MYLASVDDQTTKEREDPIWGRGVAGPGAYACTSRTRARRVAEVSRFKNCDVIGSKDKVCL